jgi:hypothetical protein
MTTERTYQEKKCSTPRLFFNDDLWKHLFYSRFLCCSTPIIDTPQPLLICLYSVLSNELYLKRLIVGGQGLGLRVSKNFRNVLDRQTQNLIRKWKYM